MAYSAIVASEIEAGDPTTQDLFTKIKNNEIDHETRIVSLEAGSATTYPPYEFYVPGPYEGYVPLLACGYIRIPFNITVLAGRLFVVTAGSGGTTQIDFKYKRGAGSWTTIFSTKPSLANTAGDLATSSNGVLSVTSLLAGDIVRLDILTTQSGTPNSLIGILEFEKV